MPEAAHPMTVDPLPQAREHRHRTRRSQFTTAPCRTGRARRRYINTPSTKADVFLLNGFFCTGASGLEGFLTLVGRNSEMNSQIINHSGGKISPIEVDAALHDPRGKGSGNRPQPKSSNFVPTSGVLVLKIQKMLKILKN
ncbi:hypothetical protein C8R46DRAFT_1038062 [Mycena filopes]|nr:hypothetical protein C8R46DRAFT_1038062 [Mycena filopes]